MSKAENIFELPKKKRTAIWNALAEAGMTPERALGLLSASQEEIQHWIQISPGYIDELMIFSSKRVGELLGIETPDRPAPTPRRLNERIIYLPAAITSFCDLRGTKAPICSENWTDGKEYTAKPGYWGIILPVSDSRRRSQLNQDEHIALTLPGYQRTPMIIDALLLSVVKLASDNDLLNGDSVRCLETTSNTAQRACLRFKNGCVYYTAIDGYCSHSVCSSAARWICD